MTGNPSSPVILGSCLSTNDRLDSSYLQPMVVDRSRDPQISMKLFGNSQDKHEIEKRNI